MRRLTIHLEFVKKEGNKIKNTLSHIIKTDIDIAHYLSINDNNVKKYYITNL